MQHVRQGLRSSGHSQTVSSHLLEPQNMRSLHVEHTADLQRLLQARRRRMPGKATDRRPTEPKRPGELVGAGSRGSRSASANQARTGRACDESCRSISSGYWTSSSADDANSWHRGSSKAVGISPESTASGTLRIGWERQADSLDEEHDGTGNDGMWNECLGRAGRDRDRRRTHRDLRANAPTHPIQYGL